MRRHPHDRGPEPEPALRSQRQTVAHSYATARTASLQGSATNLQGRSCSLMPVQRQPDSSAWHRVDHLAVSLIMAPDHARGQPGSASRDPRNSKSTASPAHQQHHCRHGISHGTVTMTAGATRAFREERHSPVAVPVTGQPTAGGIPMRAPDDSTTPSRSVTVMRRLIRPWEYRHLRAAASVRFAGGGFNLGLGLVLLSLGRSAGTDRERRKCYG